NHLDLHWDSAGELGHSHGGPGVPTVFSEDLDHQVREAVDHFGLRVESLGRAHHAKDLDHPLHLVEAAEDRARRADQIGPDLTRHLVSVFERELTAQLAAYRRTAVPLRAVARQEQKIADPHAWDVVAERLRGWRQGDAELLQLRLCAHRDPPSSKSWATSAASVSPPAQGNKRYRGPRERVTMPSMESSSSPARPVTPSPA